MDLTPEMIAEIKRIVDNGNTAENKRLKNEIVIAERKQVNRILVPVNGQG